MTKLPKMQFHDCPAEQATVGAAYLVNIRNT